MLIRSGRASDAEQIASVHVAAIREVCGLVYEAAQIEAWVSGKRPEIYLHAIANLPFVVAELDGAVVGFAELDPGAGEVRAVYVRPDCGRRGIGSRLLDAVEGAARAAALERLELKASLNSVPFYKARGFVLDELTTFTLRNGGTLPCAAMHKVLRPAPPGSAT
jgi:putative acetyltransferase